MISRIGLMNFLLKRKFLLPKKSQNGFSLSSRGRNKADKLENVVNYEGVMVEKLPGCSKNGVHNYFKARKPFKYEEGKRVNVLKMLLNNDKMMKRAFSMYSFAPRRKFSTGTALMKSDNCLPPALPPKYAPSPCEKIRENLFENCKIPVQPLWKGCDKICMPCCCPAEKPPECGVPIITVNSAKKIEYRIPAFSECKKTPINVPCPKECCYPVIFCPLTSPNLAIEPLIRTKVRQARILGRKPKEMIQARAFHTGRIFMSEKNSSKKECKPIGGLPCLKASELLGSKKKKDSKKDCERFCMPCCAPARDPPDCYYPYVKPKCVKFKPPRPAFSECKKDALKSLKPCECLITRPICDKKEKSEGSKGCGSKS